MDLVAHGGKIGRGHKSNITAADHRNIFLLKCRGALLSRPFAKGFFITFNVPNDRTVAEAVTGFTVQRGP